MSSSSVRCFVSKKKIVPFPQRCEICVKTVSQTTPESGHTVSLPPLVQSNLMLSRAKIELMETIKFTPIQPAEFDFDKLTCLMI